VFDNEAKVVFPSTQMNSNLKREDFKRSVHGIDAGGGTNLVAGLELGYQQVLANFRNEYTNRVLFLTDGVGESVGILEMAESYKEIGINVSTIGVGTDYDVDLMVALSKQGGGSSRFISDRKEMEETFGSELDRMVVPGARNLQMTLEFPDGVKVLGTWGYNNQVMGNRIYYSQPTMHMGDYETILAHIRIPPQRSEGKKELARFTCVYDTLEGETITSGPHVLNVEFVDAEFPITGFSSGKVLQSGTMLHLAENLVRIGKIYYGIDDSYYGDDFGEPVKAQLRKALDLTVATKKEVNNARVRLDNTGFDDELSILDNYIQILGGDLELTSDNVNRFKQDQEIKPLVPQRSLEDHLTRLFKEMTLDLSRKKTGVVAVSGFTRKDGAQTPLLDILDEMAVTEITKLDTLTVVERSNLEKVIDEQKLALTALMDTTTAIEIGKLLTANYIVTGSVIEMPNSVVIFGRIINVETSEVESVAQVIVPKEVIKTL
jgi:TolB-like protein